MNRVVPDAVPLATYLSAVTQGQTSETVASQHSRPSTPRLHHSDTNPPTRGSSLRPPSPPRTPHSSSRHSSQQRVSSHHLTPPDLHPITRHAVAGSTPSSVGPPHLPSSGSAPHLSYSSAVASSYAPTSSQLSISPTITRYQIMQEHMDTMHSDIASLGHKHDFAMNEISNMKTTLDTNLGNMDTNITSLRDLLINVTNIIKPTVQTNVPLVHPAARHPSTVPSHVPTDPVPIRPQSMVSSSILQPIPNRVPITTHLGMSQASSFTSVPPSHHRSVESVRVNFPNNHSTNIASNIVERDLDTDLSLPSDLGNDLHAQPSRPPNLTGPGITSNLEVRGSRISETENRMKSPANHITDPTIAPTQNTPVINNSGVHTGTMVSPSQFNSNRFLLILDNVPKIKYSNIETSLSKRSLDDDSNLSIHKLYDSIIRSLNIGFSTDLSFLPLFEQLTSETSFKSHFLHGLLGSSYDKAYNVYHQLGQLIKDRISNDDCVHKDKSPKAYLILHSYIRMDGWTLLETLFRRRLVNCGALPDTDLDSLRVTLIFQPAETIHSFFQRTQEIETEYIMQMTRHEHLIPRVKIIRRFVSELMRAVEYQPYITDFHKILLSTHTRN